MTTSPVTGSRRTATRKPPEGDTTTGAAPTGEARQKSLQQHLVTLADPDMLHPQGLYDFCESLRAISTGLAFFVHAGSTQLDQAARKGAKDAADGRLTLAQKAKLKMVLRRVSRQLSGGAGDALLDSGTAAVKAYALLEGFLEEVESDTVDRPHRNTRGGFSVSRGR